MEARACSTVILVLAALAWTTPSGDVHAADADANRPAGSVGDEAARVAADLDTFLVQSVREGFSGAVLVEYGGRIILEKGYGYADRATTTPNTVETVFNICSISKVFTASAILRLEMQGKLSVDDPLERHLGPFPGAKSAATIHHLLTHTAGLVVRGTELDGSTRDRFVRAMKDGPIESIPGEAFRYTNAGYSLLAALVEVVSGESFEAYVARNLLQPAGMTHTSFVGQPYDDDAPRAHGYGDENARTPISDDVLTWGRRGAGGMRSTVRDLYRWELALRNDAVLSAAARDKMFTAYHGDEGYGWHVATTDHGTPFHHRGCGSPGFEGQLARYPEDGISVILLCNGGRGWRRKVWDGIRERLAPDN